MKLKRYSAIILLCVLIFIFIGCNEEAHVAVPSDTTHSQKQTEKITQTQTYTQNPTEQPTERYTEKIEFEPKEVVNIIGEVDISEFGAFLDRENFSVGIWQKSLLDQMKKYSYEGRTVYDTVAGMYYDGWYGGGYEANGRNFGFHNDYTQSEDGKYATALNSFYTKVALDGLELPYGISLDDSLNGVLQKIGIDGDALAQIEENEASLILFCDGKTALSIEKKEGITSLRYTEEYLASLTDGRDVIVTRTFNLEFGSDDASISKVYMSVVSYYALWY